MVENIHGFLSLRRMGTFPESQPLTDDQKSQITSTLSKYDPSKLTAQDARAIFDSFHEAGIRPNAEGLQETVSTAGFDVQKLLSLAKPERRQDHHDGGKHGTRNGINISALQSLQSILSQYDLSNLTSDQEKEIRTQLNAAGLTKSGKTINVNA